METTMTICGRSVTSSDIRRIQSFMDENPHWHRTKLSQELCIDWDMLARKQYLHLIANNLRFLILPWVRVPHLASHVPGLIARRIRNDWIHKYGHPIYLLETFVERERFQVTSYKAANWLLVGQTKGRTRNDRYNTIRVPIKDIYLYPLTPNFREALHGIP